jgi:serine protease Do
MRYNWDSTRLGTFALFRWAEPGLRAGFMHYLSRLALVVLPLLLPCAGRGDESPRPPEVQALQEAVEKAIAAAEPAVACILVSRSEEYRKYEKPPSPDTPGKLGRFDGDALLRELPQNRKAERQALIALHLAHPENVPESFGSGVVLDKAGLILTNAHVVRNATKVYVRLPGGKGSYADIHAADARSDLAVLRLLDPIADLKPLKRGEGGKARKGHFVVQVTNPWAQGFRDASPIASWDVISDLRRRVGNPTEADRSRQTLHQYGTLWQLGQRITPGCSGGAVLNLRGELIGLTTALAAVTGNDTPAGFAIPLDAGFNRIIDVLLRGEEVEYGFLGVHMDPNNRGGRGGVHIQNVAEGTPAKRAGLMDGDQIRAINGVPIMENDDLFLVVGTHLAGSTVKVELTRFGADRTVNVTLAKFYLPGPVIAAKRPRPCAGLRVDYGSIRSQRVAQLPWERFNVEGVIIREVVPNSPADKAQLQPDKMITQVNKRHISTPSEFYAAMEKAGDRVELTLIDTEGRTEQVTLDNK